MGKRRLKIISIPCDLKAKVKKLARLNGMTCSDLIRLSIEAKLPDYEAGDQPLKGIEMQGTVSGQPPQVISDETGTGTERQHAIAHINRHKDKPEL